MKWLIAVLLVLLIVPMVCADGYSDAVAALALAKSPPKMQKHCYCSSPTDCVCDSCQCGVCAAAKKPLPAAPANTFLHDCGCPSAGCNCYSGCHCSENRAENRQNMRWKDEGGWWTLWRGSRQIGATDSKGMYFPYMGNQQWGPPCKKPIELPSDLPIKTSINWTRAAAPVCRT